jgi:SAM-dependent methyltransferase
VGLRRYFPTAKRFLEIGCGTGFVLSEIRHRFPDLSLSGSEVFSSGLALAEKRVPDVELFQMDARRIPFQDEFDVIGAFDVLEHIDDDEAVISQMWRAARRGGGVLITVPQHPFLWSRADDYAFHKRRYTRREIAARIEGAGFSIVRITSFVSLLFPLMLVSRMKQRTATTVYDPSAEMRVGGLVNALLGLILRNEGVLIKQGLLFRPVDRFVAAVKK